MALWQRHDATVVVVIPDADEALWTALEGGTYGAAVSEYDQGARKRVLSLCEAYYAIVIEELLPMPVHATPATLWEEFCTILPSFPRFFVVYHHFRRLGWLVRPGLNYGAQFVLYRGNADTYHSEYIVYVQTEASSASWHVVQALTRLAEDVKKTVLMCQVHETNDGQRSANEHSAVDEPTLQLCAVYTFNGRMFVVDAVPIRFWDTATVDQDRVSYAFESQPMILKSRSKKKPKAKTKA
ncbi:hypothetical protein Poli38472_005813 [Pythium oligandrum]|uniref:tRNA-intron lyase n=1 Tax=Pythium oligandrum TaxID=41045 RepID=A0A8K1CTE0_PYTOL|nr:hypothetical protein Poli38472_005813 [Pythium oligandrum]|eukprot:TMW68345.1 hypothetical protein Poli38472_005813 [Pythium oligandrum]